MARTRAKYIDNREIGEGVALIRQLEREISCLERQLDRLKLLHGSLDRRTLETYEEMISSRKEMLLELGF